MINVYSNDWQSTLKYLKDTEANICNILIMAGDFNIRDSDWNISYSFHLIYSNILFEIAISFDLSLLLLIQQVFTWYSNNNSNTNSVINLCFLHLNSIKLDNHIILSELWYTSDHASLVINISITEEFI